MGTQFEVIDLNRDGLPDIVAANKKGVFLFPAAEWRHADSLNAMMKV